MNQADHDQPGDSSVGLAPGSSPARAGGRPEGPGAASQVAIDTPAGASGGTGAPRRRLVRAVARHPATVQLTILLGYLAAGVAVTWPHATYLAGRLPATLDAADYVWDLWWTAHAIEHLSSPWSTTYMAAPVGTQLGFHTLMPLAGLVMLPVTALFGPSASYTLLSVALPGLLGYAMYRVARLWLPSLTGAIVAGGFFGFSAILDWQSWMHLNLAAGALFLPLTLEAAVRLRRRPGVRQAVILGLVLGLSVLVDQETAVLAAILAGAALLPWLLGPPRRARLRAAGLAVLVFAVVASPQVIAIMHETAVSGSPPLPSATEYLAGIKLPDMFAPSPRAADWGLSIPHARGWSTFGAVLTALAVLGLVLAWRRRSARLLGLLWLGAAALALGSDLHVGTSVFTPVAQVRDGVRLSSVMPFTWFVRLPGLSGFREPSRIAELGLVPAALLAGYTVNWLRYHAVLVLIVVLALGIMEAGQPGPGPATVTMPTVLPALDAPIAADHSGSVVVDVPFGVRGGVGIMGLPFAPETQVLATADGHPLGDAFLSRVPPSTAAGIEAELFYHDLMSTQTGHYQFSAAELKAAAQNARTMDVGWVLLWVENVHLQQYLTATGFRFDYRANGVSVYRPG